MEAVRDGVMETADDSALFQSWGSITIINPLEKIWNGYSDTRMGASMDSYLNGYNDPRLPVYFQPVTEGDNKGEYRGVANGMPNPQQDDYKAMSAPNVQEKSTDSPLRWMMASEVAFLRAEGAMRGWTAEMGGTAEEFYNKGIELSFLENGLSADAAARYAADETSKPTDFTDVSAANTKYNISALGKITIKWNAGASEEESDAAAPATLSIEDLAVLSVDRAQEDNLRIKDAILQVVAEHPLSDGSLANRKQVYNAVLAMKG